MRTFIFCLLLSTQQCFAACQFNYVRLPPPGEFFHETAAAFVSSVSALCFDLEAVEIELLERGYAQAYPNATPAHFSAQNFAKKHRFGLWLETNPTPPKR